MFWNIYGKRLRSTLRNKEQLVWNWLFPIVLATLFYICLSSVDNADVLNTVPVGVVANTVYEKDTTFQDVLKELEEGEDPILKVKEYSGVKEADQALKEKKIDGYLLLTDEKPKLVVKEEGMNQTILKSFLDQYVQTKNSVEEIIKENPKAAVNISSIIEKQEFTREAELSQNPYKPSYSYYYALLAMVCMYGGMQGMRSVTLLQGNLSSMGARRMMSPVNRLKMVTYDLLGGITVQLCNLFLVILYTSLVLKVDYGKNIGYIMLGCVAGGFMGVGLGAFISCLSKLGESAKTGLLISFTMMSCYAAGLMNFGTKYALEQMVPIAAMLNPASRISDTFFCLYYFDDYTRYFQNIGILFAMAAFFFVITALSLRRQNYESI